MCICKMGLQVELHSLELFLTTNMISGSARTCNSDNSTLAHSWNAGLRLISTLPHPSGHGWPSTKDRVCCNRGDI